jgi:hypothetical protein
MAERWFFFWMNHSTFQDVTFSDMMTICGGGIRFDISALCYLNILCIAMQTIPAKFRDTVGYQRAVKYIYLIINTIGIFMNVADVVYFDFGGRRTTATFFAEFGNENNIGKILMICRDCIAKGTEPLIDYELLRRANIHILGRKLTF